MTIRPASEIMLSAVQEHTKDEIDEAISILEQETQRRIEDVQQRVEFICASLKAQGNTQINKMLKSVRELTVEEFCETYEANTQKFLMQQAQQRLANTSNDTKRKRTLGNAENDMLAKRRKGSNTDTEVSKLLDNNVHIQSAQSKNIPSTQPSPSIAHSSQPQPEKEECNKDIQVERADKMEVEKNEEKEEEIQEEEEVQEEEKAQEEKEVQEEKEAEKLKEKEINRQETEAVQEKKEAMDTCDPIYIHLSRENEPKISIKFDPQRTAKQLGSYAIGAPLDQISTWRAEQKSNVQDQIQHLQNQLDIFKKSLA